MAGMWNQGGQPQMAPAPRRTANPPPVCFNCDEEGHFVVQCPRPPRLNNAVFPIPPVPQFQTQQAPQPNHAQAGPLQQPYQAQAGPPQQQQYQQPIQYPAQQPVQQSQHYGGLPAQPPYNQVLTPQPYSAPLPVVPYGRPGFQPPAYNQFPSQAPPQQSYAPPVYQNVPTPAVPPFHVPQPNYTPQNHAPAGNYGMAPNPQQWNNSPQVPRNVPPFQRPQRSMSQVSQNSQNGFQVPHNQQIYVNEPGVVDTTYRPSQFSGGSQQHQQSMAPKQMPHATQVFNSSANNQAATRSARSSTSSRVEGVVPSSVGTPRRSESLVSSIEKPTKTEEKTPTVELQHPVATVQESPEPEDEDQQFEWDLKHIFTEFTCSELIPLAQPLAGALTQEMAPILQFDQDLTKSVSRYARDDNLEDYIKGIRDTEQWEFAQSDPVFAELRQDCPLIPIEKVAAWIAKRQDIINPVEAKNSRKRAWSNEQDGVDAQISQELSEDINDLSRSVKRQKNEDIIAIDDIMTEAQMEQDVHAPGTPCLAVQMLSGSIVEAPENAGDAWAPEPGEVGSISSPANPTEALLASLGVTGDAKPAKSESLPAYSPKEQQDNLQEQSLQSQHNGLSPNPPPPPAPLPVKQQDFKKPQGTPIVNQQNQMPQIAPNAPPYGPPSNLQYGDNQPPNGPPQNQQHGPQRSASWSNGPPHNANFAGPSQSNPANYGPPANPIYQAGKQVPAPNSNSQHEAQRSASYPNPQYGPPQYNNSTQMNANFGPGGGPPQHGHGYGQQLYANGQSQPQFGAPQYGNQQYANAPQQGPPQWVNGQQQYNNTSHGPSQYPSGPQGQHQYGSGSQAPQHYGNGPPIQQPYNNNNQGPQQHGNGSQMQQGYNIHQGPPQFGNGPPSQQSNGYYQQGQPQYGGMGPNQQQSNGYQQGPNHQGGFQQPNGSFPQNGYQEQNGPQQGETYQQDSFQQHNGHQQNGPNQQHGYQHNGLQQNGHNHQNGFQQNGPQQNWPNQQHGFQHNGPRPQNNLQQQGGPPQNQSQLNRVPPRQDSGYMSARGSYSNDSGQNGFQQNAQDGSHGQAARNENQQQESQDTQTRQIEETEAKMTERDESESDSDTPLSPTSAEILGKLEKKGSKGKGNRKTKRPQPVVAAAYSRRW